MHLGYARLQKSYHTLVHYFDLDIIESEINQLNQNYDDMKIMLNKHRKHYHELENYNNLIRFYFKSVQDKLNNVYSNKINRNKRGLINGLGSTLKFITGNMDSDDANRINKILRDLKVNEFKLQSQISNQYSLNEELIKQFNFSVQNVQHNEQILKNKIIELSHEINQNSIDIELLQTKDLYNQLILMYNAVLNMLTEIENSITFCAIGAMHPSIIKASDLLKELQKLKPFYNNELPLPVTIDNIINYQSLISVHCLFDNSKIHYFLKIPIEYDIKFKLYYLEPLPTLIENEYFTIIPNSKFLIQSNDQIRPLSGPCTMSKIYHCSSKLLTNVNVTCEDNILKHGSPIGCLFTRIKIEEDHLEPIPQINQYLGWFHANSTVIIECPEEKQLIQPHGTFLIQTTNRCNISLNGYTFQHLEPTVAVPMFIKFKQIQLKKNLETSNMSIQLNQLSLRKLRINPIAVIKNEHKTNYSHSIFTSIFYVAVLILVLGLLIRKKFKKPKKPCQGDSPHQEDSTNHLRLPCDASF